MFLPSATLSARYHFRFARSNGRIVARVEHHDDDGPVLVTSVSGDVRQRHAWRASAAAFFGAADG